MPLFCFYGTAAEAALQAGADGMYFGPYASVDECNENCANEGSTSPGTTGTTSSSTTTTTSTTTTVTGCQTCCPGVPVDLVLTVTGSDCGGDGSCIIGHTAVLHFDPIGCKWDGTLVMTQCGALSNLDWSLACNGGGSGWADWRITSPGSCTSFPAQAPDSGSCSPFQLDFSFSGIGACCGGVGGSLAFTITDS